MNPRCAAAALALIACALTHVESIAAATVDPAAYAALAGHKALAVAGASTAEVISGAPSAAAASAAALRQCNSSRRADAGVCEIVRLDDIAVATGSEIRARVPRTPHPLFLWQFDAGASRVYLAGSIHVMKQSLWPLPTQFEHAFGAAQRIAVEVDTNALAPEQIRQAFRRAALLPLPDSLNTVLRSTTLDALERFLQNQAVSLADVAGIKPMMLATQLAVAHLGALGYLPEFGLEQHFTSAAGARPILELETLDQQLEVLTSPPLAVQDEILMETVAQMDTIEPIITAMIVAWFSGDEAEFARLFDLQNGDSPETRAFVRRLLEDRNVGMAEKIAGYLSVPGTTFVLVGAAHLTGPEGIVALLEARGLRGRRVNSNDPI
jgi:uncharacterized protein YbaP (TraB family)